MYFQILLNQWDTIWPRSCCLHNVKSLEIFKSKTKFFNTIKITNIDNEKILKLFQSLVTEQ